jgi:hypothetical protein
MKFARHWIRERAEADDDRGKAHVAECWGWSDHSVDEARSRAREKSNRVARWLARQVGAEPPHQAVYAYGLDRPLREEILQELPDDNGDVAALLTRNALGVIVLNTRDLMFVDVDLPRKPWRPPSPSGWFARLLGREKAPPPDADPPEVVRIRQWCVEHPECATRIYRTAAGFRVAIVDCPRQPTSAETMALLETLGSDPLYRRLCQAQECFRARLTPKPWRMNLHPPPGQFPRVNPREVDMFENWLAEYDGKAPQFATCRLIETQGPAEMHAEFGPLIDLHDSLTGCDRSAQLA